MERFRLVSKFKPAGDQPKAIRQLVAGLGSGFRHQTLLGVTGSGKTFTMAAVIAAVQKPTLVIAHNKTLAAQLAQEYQDFFPENAVRYFVSYYDYYQPEAYLPASDTYIEKEARINEEIDRLRHAATQALLSRRDVIVAASVSCLYNLGSPSAYQAEHLKVSLGERLGREDLIKELISLHYQRTNADLKPGFFRAIGNSLEVIPAGGETAYQIIFESERVAELAILDSVSRRILEQPEAVFIFPAKHFLLPANRLARAIRSVQRELAERLAELTQAGKRLEAERLKRRTNYDLALLEETGYCHGIENYSRHFDGRRPGEPPETLLSYFSATGRDFLTVIDESHVTIPQLAGMYEGDRSRKETLIEHGFRLPSALDNRPLTFGEFEKRISQVIYTSATPGEYERQVSRQIVEQIIRPTGLLDPELSVRPVTGSAAYPGQVHHFINESQKAIRAGGRVLCTTLTKRMAEDLSDYLKEQGIKANYLHSEIKTLERVKILSDFRRGKFDCLVGVNLLREGLDLPEVTLIGILDADKEGFLRSDISLIQIIGRAARNVLGRVILYADQLTGSLQQAIEETNRRRKLQLAYNRRHKITPQTIVKKVKDITEALESERERAVKELSVLDLTASGGNRRRLIKEKERQMAEAVKELDFETAALLRDEIKALTGNTRGIRETRGSERIKDLGKLGKGDRR